MVGEGVNGVDEAGTGDEVTMNVAVGVEKSGVLVGVGDGVDVLVFVIVISGVLVATFGTQSTWPTLIFTEDPIQLAFCKSATVVLYNREMRYKLSPAFTV